MNIRTKLILSAGILAGMIIPLLVVNLLRYWIRHWTDSPAAMPTGTCFAVDFRYRCYLHPCQYRVAGLASPFHQQADIQELTRNLEIANHNYEKRLDMSGHEEFRQVADSFNSMAERLTEYRAIMLNDILSAKKFLEAAVNSIHEPIIGLELWDEILFINKEALTVLNLKTWRCNPPLSWGTVLKEWSPCRLVREPITPGEKKEPWKSMRIIRKAIFRLLTSPLWIRMPIRMNRRIGDVILLKNITEFKELDSAKITFISTISHELKTPISAILMSLQLLEDKRVELWMMSKEQLSKALKRMPTACWVSPVNSWTWHK